MLQKIEDNLEMTNSKKPATITCGSMSAADTNMTANTCSSICNDNFNINVSNFTNDIDVTVGEAEVEIFFYLLRLKNFQNKTNKKTC